MPRSARHAPGGFVFHFLNRGVGRRTLFHKEQDFDAFERVLPQCDTSGVRLAPPSYSLR